MLLVNYEFAFEINQLTVFLHCPHQRPKCLIDILLTLRVLDETKRSINFVHQKYEILQVDPASGFPIELHAVINEILVVFLRDHTCVLLIRRAETFNYNCYEQI